MDPETLHPELKWIYRFQKITARLLDLTTQWAWERDLKLSQVTSVDLPMARIREHIEKEGSTFLSKEMKEYVVQLESWDPQKSDPAKVDATKNALLRLWLADVRDYTKRTGKDPLERLNSMRDDAIFEGIRERLAKVKSGSIAIVYGALHTWKLEPRFITELGFRYESNAWYDVLSCWEPKAPPADKKANEDKK